MNDIIQRIADVLMEEFGGIIDEYYPANEKNRIRSNMEDCARQIIMGMREPTEEMMMTGAMVRGNHQPFGSPKDWNNDSNCAGIWRGMIDAALELK